MEEPSIHEQSAAYALHALPESDATAFEEHLASCTICAAELGSLRAAAAAIAYATAEESPSPALRGRVLRQVRKTPGVPVVMRSRWVIPTAVVAAAAAVAFAVWAISLDHSLSRERSRSAADARAVAVLASPGVRRYALMAAHGTLAVAPGGDAVLVVSGLRPAPHGKSYEAWVVAAGEPQPAGVFAGGGRTTLPLTRRVPVGARVGVSLERAGGVPRLTGMLLFGAQTA